MRDAPMLLIMGDSLSVPSLRSGRKAANSRSTAIAEPATTAATSPRGRGRPRAVIASQPTKAHHMKVAAWARLMMSRTPKIKVKPSAYTE